MHSKKDQTAMILDMDFLKKNITDRLMPNILSPVVKKPKL